MRKLYTISILCFFFQTLSAYPSNFASSYPQLDVSLNCTPTQTFIVVEECEEYWAPDGVVYTESGIYTADLVSYEGCDSTVFIDLTIFSSYVTYLVETTCDSFININWNCSIFNDSITEYSFTSMFGCDSTIILDLTIIESTYANSSITQECSNYTAPDGSVYTNSGIYNYSLTNAAGCDSIITLDLQLLGNNDTTFISQSFCDFMVLNDGTFINESTIIEETHINSSGCDSIVVYQYILLPTDQTYISEYSCESYYINDLGDIYTSSGIYTFVLNNIWGCDSIISLDLQLIGNNIPTYIAETFCGQMTLDDGTVISGDTTIQVTYTTTPFGCDSTIVYEFYHTPTSSSFLNASICEGYYIDPIGDQLTASGIYTYNLTNVAGCDSIITLDLQVLGSDVPTYISQSFCDQMILDDGTVIFEDTIIQETYVSSTGCDSILIYQYDQLPVTTTNIDEISCEEYFDLNGNVITTSGIYFYNLTNVMGCDSIIALDLVIVEVDETITQDGTTLIANEADATYQWVNCDNNNEPILNAIQQSYTPLTTGNYAVIITTIEGCENISECTESNIVSNDEIFENSLTVFPNPSSGELHINLSERSDNTSVSIFNALGQLTQTKIYRNQSSIDFNLNGASGLYLLLIENENGDRAELKIVKE